MHLGLRAVLGILHYELSLDCSPRGGVGRGSHTCTKKTLEMSPTTAVLTDLAM